MAELWPEVGSVWDSKEDLLLATELSALAAGIGMCPVNSDHPEGSWRVPEATKQQVNHRNVSNHNANHTSRGNPIEKNLIDEIIVLKVGVHFEDITSPNAFEGDLRSMNRKQGKLINMRRAKVRRHPSHNFTFFCKTERGRRSCKFFVRMSKNEDKNGWTCTQVTPHHDCEENMRLPSDALLERLNYFPTLILQSGLLGEATPVPNGPLVPKELKYARKPGKNVDSSQVPVRIPNADRSLNKNRHSPQNRRVVVEESSKEEREVDETRIPKASTSKIPYTRDDEFEEDEGFESSEEDVELTRGKENRVEQENEDISRSGASDFDFSGNNSPSDMNSNGPKFTAVGSQLLFLIDEEESSEEEGGDKEEQVEEEGHDEDKQEKEGEIEEEEEEGNIEIVPIVSKQAKVPSITSKKRPRSPSPQPQRKPVKQKRIKLTPIPLPPPSPAPTRKAKKSQSLYQKSKPLLKKFLFKLCSEDPHDISRLNTKLFRKFLLKNEIGKKELVRGWKKGGREKERTLRLLKEEGGIGMGVLMTLDRRLSEKVRNDGEEEEDEDNKINSFAKINSTTSLSQFFLLLNGSDKKSHDYHVVTQPFGKSPSSSSLFQILEQNEILPHDLISYWNIDEGKRLDEVLRMIDGISLGMKLGLGRRLGEYCDWSKGRRED